MRKYWIAVIAAGIISILIVVISMISRPVVAVPDSVLKSARSVIDNVSLTAVNAELDDNLDYTVTAEDAQLYIGGIEDKTEFLLVDLGAPLPYGTTYKLYYSKGKSQMSEINSVLGKSLGDSDKLLIRLPAADHYDELRLDIDTNYTIEDIAIIGKLDSGYIGDSYFSSVIKGRSPFPIKHFLLTFIIILSEALLVAWKYESIRGLWEKAKENKSTLIRLLVTCLVCIVMGFVSWLLFYKMEISHSASKYTVFCYICICLTAGLLVVFHREIGANPEKGFVIIALSIGLILAVLEPSSTYMSFDDEIHYSRALRLSYGDSAFLSDVEFRVMMREVSNQVTIENKDGSSEYLNALPFRERGGNYNADSIPYYVVPSYIPAAAGIWLTRILGLRYTSTLIAGRVCNVLCYCIVVYFAIKQLKYGKLFLGALSLLPTILFLAANYSYDTFCIAFILLGVCIWLSVYQRPESKMTGEKAAAMLTAFAIGILPKTVYFPMTLVALFLPRSRFNTKTFQIRYRWAVILTTALLMFSIAAPFLFGNAASDLYNDVRGGAAIDAKSQIRFILANPMLYGGILLRNIFLIYLQFSQMMLPVTGCIRAMCYLDWQEITFYEKVAYAYLLVVFIAWLLSCDRYADRRDGMPIWVKVIICVLAFGTICITVTSLYCAYTEVGSNGIGGFQERYLLPVLIPLFLILRPTIYFDKEIRLDWINIRIVYAEALLLFVGMWPFISRFI